MAKISLDVYELDDERAHAEVFNWTGTPIVEVDVKAESDESGSEHDRAFLVTVTIGDEKIERRLMANAWGTAPIEDVKLLPSEQGHDPI